MLTSKVLVVKEYITKETNQNVKQWAEVNGIADYTIHAQMSGI